MSDAVVGAGFVLAGRYRLVEPLASGGMGTVWRAVDVLLDRPVAVKEVRLPPGLDDDARQQLRRRTIREAQAAARLRHSATVTIYDVVEHDGRPWIVMELVPSRSLAEIIRTEGPLPPVRVASIALRVLGAIVAIAAAGIEHRDVKPANVLVTNEGRVVLTDFGIARYVGDETLTTAGLIVGSPDYLAPERARGLPAGIAADLWSLGATMYDAVEGRPPFERDGPLPTLAAVVMDEPDPPRRAGPLLPVIDRLLVKDPAHRLDADGTRSMLEQVLRGRPAAPGVPLPRRSDVPLAPSGRSSATADTPTVAYATPTPRADEAEITTPPGRRRRSALIAVLVVLVLAALAAVLVPVLSTGGQDQATGPSTPTAAPTTPTTTAPSTTAPSTTAPSTTAPSTTAPSRPSATPATGSRVTPPAGFTRYTDPRDGFSLVIPSGWTPVRRDTRVDLTDPSSSRFVRIDTSDRPLADPYQNWIDYERQFRQGKAGYRLIDIRRVDYRPEEGWTTADWEFTLGGQHVLDRNIRVSAARAHAIYWSTPQDRWDAADSRRILRLVEQSFVPAPAG